MVKSEAGFSSVEVIVATLLLSVGVLGAARASADMTRVLSQSDRMATATVHSQERIERLRAVGCAGMTNGSEAKPDGFTLTWTVQQTAGSPTRTVRVSASYNTPHGTRADTVETSVSCV